MKKTETNGFLLLNFSKQNFRIKILTFVLLTSVFSMHAKIVEKDGKGVHLKNAPLQEKWKVSGTILDSKGMSLPGANIVEKGKKNGSQSDFDGNFSITVEDQNAILIVSYLGYINKEIAVNGQKFLSIVLKEDASSLNEVVVVGYGTQKKSDITGSVASVQAKDLQALPISRVDQALQGRISGVTVQNNDASPNSSTSIRIRGANSINGGNNPLVIIDGFQGGDLSSVHPNDIKSVEVLKDASATAIYGSRGANGVILITTNTGKKEKATVSYSTYMSSHQVRNKIDLMNPLDYANTVNANRAEFSLFPVFSSSDISGFASGKGTDWQDQIFRNAISKNHNISVSGGSDALTYFVSGDLLDNQGIIKGSSYQRYSLRSNLNADITKKLKLKTNLFLAKETDHPTALNSFNPGNGGSPVFSSLIFSPTKSVYDDNGKYTQPGGGAGPPTNFNPLALAVEPIRDNFVNTTSVNIGLDYEIIDGLKFSVSGGYRLLDRENNEYLNSKPTNGGDIESAGILNNRFLTLQNTNLVNYTKQFNDHNLNLTAAFEQQSEEFNENWSGSRSFLTDGVSYNNLGLGSNPQVPYSTRNERTLKSYLSRINYGYKSKYLVTLTARADGSSVFGADKKWGYFPSAALAWNVTNEDFLKDNKVITNLKLRATYGITGNQAISPYQSFASLNTGASYPINGVNLSTGVSLGGLANPNLKWEETTQSNVGVDLKLFNGRVDVVADYYKKSTKDLLLNVPLPQAGGGNGNVLRNVGEVENKGIELYLSIKPVVTDNFTWESAFTFAKNKNKVVALNEGLTEIPLGGAGLPGFDNTIFLEVGQPIGLFRGIKYAGVWKTAEATQAALYGAFPGAPKFVDQNSDNIIDDSDIVNIGNAQPDFTYGWNNSFTYKNFDLNVFMQGVEGNDIYNLSRVRTDITTSDSDATSTAILNRWSTQNENTDVPSFTGSKQFPRQQTSRWIEDGSYLRIKNISLGYYLPKQLINKLKISSFKIYATGTNLFTITNYSGFDPEASTSVDTRGGIDLATYPTQKILTLGLNVKL
ncbi:SusC/RagA family TonB-linked outer membrane protein [Flavobacterium sp. LB1P62]|uniref:SusC/RagA family TonB-linked outer membrane protein n=1 Tax=Flavobacterium sp. LB1P62 TaxID=3401715 RepID=UPI003AADE271